MTTNLLTKNIDEWCVRPETVERPLPHNSPSEDMRGTSSPMILRTVGRLNWNLALVTPLPMRQAGILINCSLTSDLMLTQDYPPILTPHNLCSMPWLGQVA